MNNFKDLLYRMEESKQNQTRQKSVEGRRNTYASGINNLIAGGSLGITPLNKAWENRKEAVKEWARRDMQRPIPKPYHPRDNPHIDPGVGNPNYLYDALSIPGTGNWSFINQPSYRLAGNPSFDINPAANKSAQRKRKIENLGKGSTNPGEQEAAKEALKRLGGGINLPPV
jgi:hypothetical protein